MAVASETRSLALPDVPTLPESGLSGFEVQSWFLLMTPSSVPKPVLDRLSLTLEELLASEPISQALSDLDPSRGAATARPPGRLFRQNRRVGGCRQALGCEGSVLPELMPAAVE